MYFPPNFDVTHARELGQLVKLAYAQHASYKEKQPWSLPSEYELICPINYHVLVSFAPEEGGPTIIDLEAAENPVAFGLGDFFNEDIPMGFVAKRGNQAFLVFRGTVTGREWFFDLEANMRDYRLKNWGQVASGFMKIYDRCRESFIEALGALPAETQLFITGHSLGAALSTVALPDVVDSTHFKSPTLYNFASPRVGDNTFVQAFNALPGKRAFRLVNTSDVVTTVPFPTPLPLIFPSGFYSHIDTPVDFTVQANDVGKNHSMDLYLQMLEG